MEFGRYVGFGVAVSFAAYSFYARNYEKKIREGSYYDKSLTLLKGYKPATEIFGEPIKTERVEVDHEFNELNKKVAKLRIPVYGPKSNGHLYSWSSKLEDDSDWRVDQLDIEVRKPDTRRWTFYKREQQSSIPSS